MKPLSGLDGMFLHLETPATPMHVGSLSLLEPPASYRGDFCKAVERLYARRLPLALVLSRKLAAMPLQLANPIWVQVDDVDMKYHIGACTTCSSDIEECVGRLHSILLDRARPTLDGVRGRSWSGRHSCSELHALLFDGQAAVMLARVLFDLTPREASGIRPRLPVRRAAASTPALARWLPRPWNTMPSNTSSSCAPDRQGADQSAQRRQRQGVRVVRRNVGIRTQDPTQRRHYGRACLRRRLGPARPDQGRCRGPRREDQRHGAGHLLSGALRRYLLDQGGLPSEPLIAAVPISLREPGNTEYTTPATMARVSLATDIANPVRRLCAIRARQSPGNRREVGDRPRQGDPAHRLSVLRHAVDPALAQVGIWANKAREPGPPTGQRRHFQCSRSAGAGLFRRVSA